MAERPAAMVNQVLDKIVLQIKTHVDTYPHLWARVPVIVKRHTGPSDTRGEFPTIVVRAESPVDDTFQGTLNVHRAETGFLVHWFDADVSDPEGAAHDAAADIRRALAADEQLGTVLQSGSLEPRGYEWGVQPGESGAGLIETVLRYRANYEWNHDTT